MNRSTVESTVFNADVVRWRNYCARARPYSVECTYAICAIVDPRNFTPSRCAPNFTFDALDIENLAFPRMFRNRNAIVD